MGYYTNPSAISATVTVTVSHGPSASGPWTDQQTLYTGTQAPDSSGFAIEDFVFSHPGYYNFTITGEATDTNHLIKSDVYSVTAGPTLSEPEAIAGLSIALAAIGLVIIRKKPNKK